MDDDVAIVRDAMLCGIEEWMQIWGDPLLSGTIYMVSYGVTALLIFRAARVAEGRERWYWRLCGFLFLFQFANTHLDLHALIWTTGRCLAHAQGWYDYRRELQVGFLIGVTLLIALVLCIVMILFIRNLVGNILLTLGVAIALGFTLVKGINYHGLEHFYNVQVGPFYTADFIEFSGIALAFFATLIKLSQYRFARE